MSEPDDAVDADAGAYAALDALAACVAAYGCITSEESDLLEQRTQAGDDALLLGRTLAGLVRAVLDLPERSSMRRALVVTLNEALEDGELGIRFSLGSLGFGLAKATVAVGVEAAAGVEAVAGVEEAAAAAGGAT